MAVCEIWDVRGRLDSPLRYAANPDKTGNPRYTEAEWQSLSDVMKYATNGDKTEQQFFVSGINCDPSTAREEMRVRSYATTAFKVSAREKSRRSRRTK